MAKYPIGVRFYLTDEESVSCLLKTINSQQLPSSDFISTDDLYGGGKEPWELFGDSTERRYFFTKINKSGVAGIWSRKGPRIPIYGRGKQLIGYKRCFRYERKKICGDGDVHQINEEWLLKEYVLPDDDVTDYALCVVKKKFTAPLVVSRDEVDNDQDCVSRFRCCSSLGWPESSQHNDLIHN